MDQLFGHQYNFSGHECVNLMGSKGSLQKKSSMMKELDLVSLFVISFFRLELLFVQVMLKMKSRHVAGTITKKKKSE